MGNYWGGGLKQHLYLHTWVNPRVQEQRVRVPVRFALCGLDHTDASRVSLKIVNDPALRQRLLHKVVEQLDPHQRAIVLRVYAFYIHNEFHRDILLGNILSFCCPLLKFSKQN